MKKNMPVRYVLGLMSGTSADGIDSACVRITGRGAAMKAELIQHQRHSFSRKLRDRLLAIMAPAQCRTEEIAFLHAEMGRQFARAASRAIAMVPRLCCPTLIGVSGQTVCHLPGVAAGRTCTLQIGEAAQVAEQTGLATVCEFRQSDVAAGGQGAPLVPWTDWVLFHHSSIHRAVQNIGGIANVSWLPAGGNASDVVAFDTGPGNMVIDAIVSWATRGTMRMDRDGRLAARGQILQSVLRNWLKHPYFRRKVPKTTGREMFGATFVAEQLPVLRRASQRAEDWIATATAFTAHSIVRSCRPLLKNVRKQRRPEVQWILCGGGAENPTLVRMLREQAPHIQWRPIAEFNIPSAAKESLSFAMLAAACVDHTSANLPRATGARHPTVLGRIIIP